MYISDTLVYLELQKTGGSHICRLLEQYTHGLHEGKHSRYLGDSSTSYVVGSIRNPWDWYVSLWAFGVGHQGAIRSRVVTGVDLDYYYRGLPKSMGKNWPTPVEWFASFSRDLFKPIRKWEKCYQDSENPAQFQAWLKLIYDSERRYDLGEGYGFSPLFSHAGLLTYRYFRLYTTGNHVYKDKRLRSNETIGDFDRDFNVTSGMIRTETLEEDFVRVLGEAGHSLAENQIDAILRKEGGKTNISKRKPVGYYYDDETIELVANRERFLIQKYKYKPPVIY